MVKTIALIPFYYRNVVKVVHDYKRASLFAPYTKINLYDRPFRTLRALAFFSQRGLWLKLTQVLFLHHRRPQNSP